MDSSKIRIATINARGLNNTSKRLSLFRWINDHSVDITLLQETYCTKDYESKFSKQWAGRIFHSHTDSSHSRGV